MFSFDQIAEFFIGVQVNTCAQWQRLFHVFRWRARLRI